MERLISFDKQVIATCELSGQNLYVATSTHRIINYIISYKDQLFDARLECETTLPNVANSISSIVAIPTEGKLLVHYDSSIVLLNSADLSLASSPTTTIKGVVCYSLDALITTPCLFVVGKRRLLQIWSLQEGRPNDALSCTKEVQTPNGILAVTSHSGTVLFLDYTAFNILTSAGALIQLFPHGYQNPTNALQPILSITDNEFFLVDASGLGVFIDACGNAVKGTLELETGGIKSCAFHFPYIVTLSSKNTLQIHNYYTQSLIQSIPLPSNPQRLLTSIFPLDYSVHSSIKVTLSTKDTLYALPFPSITEQINTLISTGALDEALALSVELDRWERNELGERGRRVYKRVADEFFKKGSWVDWERCLEFSLLDWRGVVRRFPKVWEYAFGDRFDDDEHNDVDIDGIVDEILQDIIDESERSEQRHNLLIHANDSLITYLVFCKCNSELNYDDIKDINTLLIYLYANNPEKLEEFIDAEVGVEGKLINLDLRKCVDWLLEEKLYQATIKILKSHKLYTEMMDIYIKIIETTDTDTTDQILPFLAQQSPSFILTYLPSLLSINPEKFIKILLSPHFPHPETMQSLAPYPKHVQSTYVQYLYYTEKIRDTQVVGWLMQYFLDEVSEDSVFDHYATYKLCPFPKPYFRTHIPHTSPRRKLIDLVRTHPVPDSVMEQMTGKGLRYELSWVKLSAGDWQGFVRGLLGIGDFAGVEKEVILEGDSCRKERLEFVLAFFLDGDCDDHIEEVCYLFNFYGEYLDIIHYLAKIPSHWSMQKLLPYLTQRLLKTSHDRKVHQVKKKLVVGEYTRVYGGFIRVVEGGGRFLKKEVLVTQQQGS